MRRASIAEKHVPMIPAMEVLPIADHDASYFTRNLLILSDSDGNTGVGEVPGGEAARSRP